VSAAGLPSLAILAGGRASRLGTLAASVPKALQPIGDRPFLAWQLELAHEQGIRDVVLCVGHLGELIERALPSSTPPGMRVRCSFDGEQALGTGGALQRALPLLSDPFLVMYGDSYLRGDYARVCAAFERAGDARGMMTVFRNEGRFDTSNIEYAEGRILRYDKRTRDARMEHIDWGMGVLRHAAFAGFPGAFDLAEVYHRLLAQGRLAGHEVQQRFYEIGSPEALEELRQLLAPEHREATASEDPLKTD
jgi:N-acetyl-alpha-D-muramate 1-phosphate uridylyltransferase